MKIIDIAFSILPLGLVARASELKWIEPYEAAKSEAKHTGKPMLVSIGNTQDCKGCQALSRLNKYG